MRALIAIALVVSGLWSGYWFIGSGVVERGAERWFTEQAAQQGIIAEKSALSVAGFPSRFDLTVEGIKLADPATGMGWEAPFAQVFALTYMPWHIIAALPNTQVVKTPDQDIGIASTRLMVSARATPNLALPLAELRLDGSDLLATSTKGWALGAKELLFAVRADDIAPAAYHIGLSVTDFTPDPAFIASLTAQSDLPPAVQVIHADLMAHLSATLDRHAGETQPKLTGLDVTGVEISWGTLSLTAKGMVAPDAAGFAAGRVEIEIRNWQEILPVLVATGAVKPEVAPTIGNMLAAMAKDGGDETLLKLPLVMKDGHMSLGPVPLGPAPSFAPPSN